MVAIRSIRDKYRLSNMSLKSLKPLLKPVLKPPVDWVSKTFYAPLKRRYLHRQITSLRNQGRDVKLVVGSGGIPIDGWVLTNLPVLDMLNSRHWQAVCPPASLNRVLAEHVIEHLTEAQFVQFLACVRPYLAPNARIRIAVPDGYHPSPTYIDHVKPQGTGPGADEHQLLYTYKTLTHLLTTNNYAYQLVEHFDENGTFHKIDWRIEDGFIRRSADYDRRNQQAPLTYTSLIVDFWAE